MPSKKEKKTRTDSQNNAMHKYFDDVAVAANQEGITFTEFIRRRPRLEMPWTAERVKDVWKTAQFLMYGTKSTADLTTEQVTKVYDVVNKALGEIIGIHVPFPSMEGLMLEQYD